MKRKMLKRWEDKALIGIVFPKLFPKALENMDTFKHSLLTILRDPFFTAVEISYMPDEDMRKLALDFMQKSGVEVVFNGGDAFRQLQIDLSNLDENIRMDSIKNGKKLIDQSYEMNCKILHIVTGKYTGEEQRIEMIKMFEQSCIELCQYAKEKAKDYELTISLETGDRHFDRRYLLGPTNEAMKLLNHVQSVHDNFGILLDQSHFPLMGEDFHKALWKTKDALTHVHMGNCYSKDREKFYFGDKHLPFGVPDSEIGVEEVAALLRTLEDTGFFKQQKPTRKPLLSFEVGPYDGEDPELVIANVKRVFYEAWCKI